MKIMNIRMIISYIYYRYDIILLWCDVFFYVRYIVDDYYYYIRSYLFYLNESGYFKSATDISWPVFAADDDPSILVNVFSIFVNIANFNWK